MASEVRVKRIYDEPSDDDGFRVLVDRLWPRGVTKEAARIDLWAKEFAPSSELRKWFHANPNRFDEFADRYLQELGANCTVVSRILGAIRKPVITLLTATKIPEEGHVTILKHFLGRVT